MIYKQTQGGWMIATLDALMHVSLHNIYIFFFYVIDKIILYVKWVE